MRRGLLLACLFSLAVPAGASAAVKLQPPSDAPRPFATPFRDVTPPAKVQARAAASPRASAAAYTRYKISGGPYLEVALSDSLGSPAHADVQSFLNAVFVWMAKPAAYGSEVSKIKVLVEKTSEMQTDCGSTEALACYSPTNATMYLPNEDTPQDQAPLDFVVAHEYGHHIAANRTNYPFDAGNWGPKHWATTEKVCPRVANKQLYPGDEGSHYAENPGEGWAESFAMRLYPQYLQYWGYSPLLKPNAAAFGAIRHDVQSPWKKSARKAVRWYGRGSKIFRLKAPLDGYARVRVTGVPGASLRLRGYLSHKSVGTSRGRSASMLICGNRSAAFKVRRVSGAGRLTIHLARP